MSYETSFRRSFALQLKIVFEIAGVTRSLAKNVSHKGSQVIPNRQSPAKARQRARGIIGWLQYISSSVGPQWIRSAKEAFWDDLRAPTS
jgi:hypothetical protein